MKTLAAVFAVALVAACTGGEGDDYPVKTPTVVPGAQVSGSTGGSGSGSGGEGLDGGVPTGGDGSVVPDAFPTRDAPIGHDGAIGFDSGFVR